MIFNKHQNKYNLIFYYVKSYLFFTFVMYFKLQSVKKNVILYDSKCFIIYFFNNLNFN